MSCALGIRFASMKGGAQASPRPHWVTRGEPGHRARQSCTPGVDERPWSPEALCPAPVRVLGRLRSLLARWRKGPRVPVGCPSPAPEAHWHTKTCRPSCESDGMRVQRCGEGVANRSAALSHRHRHGGRPARSVWGSHRSAVPAKRKQVRTRCQRMTTPGSLRRKKAKIRSEGTFVS
jgi:hypothetical protein